MAEVLKGAPVTEALNRETIRMVEGLKGKGITPTLAIVRIGENEDDITYEHSAMKRCEKVGLSAKQVTLPGGCTQEELLSVLHDLNNSSEVHGILLLRPLPKHMDDDKVRNTISPEKDVDGITDQSLAGVFTGTSGKGFAPCTAQACMEVLDHYGIDPKGKRAVVVGRSLVVGKPVAMMLTARHATVTICHTWTVDMPAICRAGEILIVSAGRAKIIGREHLSFGQAVIDVGINVLPDGKLCGDVDFEAAEALVAAITPVPGGIGTVTTSVLVRNVAKAAAAQITNKG